MTEEPNEPTSNEPQTEKLLIDDPSSFQFHAAYLVYSEAFDHAGEDARKELNLSLEDLKSNKIDLRNILRKHFTLPQSRADATTRRKIHCYNPAKERLAQENSATGKNQKAQKITQILNVLS